MFHKCSTGCSLDASFLAPDGFSKIYEIEGSIQSFSRAVGCHWEEYLCQLLLVIEEASGNGILASLKVWMLLDRHCTFDCLFFFGFVCSI